MAGCSPVRPASARRRSLTASPRALLAGPDARDPALAVDRRSTRCSARSPGGSHPDLKVIEPQRDPQAPARLKSEIPVDMVRAATASLNTTAALGGYRIVVIDGAESLNRNAANALLKSLEEPPPDAILLLVSHRPAASRRDHRARAAPSCALARLPDAEVSGGAGPACSGPAARAARRADAAGARQHRPRHRACRATTGSRSIGASRPAWPAAPLDRLVLHELSGELARATPMRAASQRRCG